MTDARDTPLMKKFRKKPVVIEAFQFTRDVALAALCQRVVLPFGLRPSGSWHEGRGELHAASLSIDTLEGRMRADIDDWIIKGVKDELYPCKPDIFEATYAPADEESGADADRLALQQQIEPEVCVCAALLMTDGYIFRGHRHDDCYLTLIGNLKYTKADGHAAKQGFLTSRGRFVTRSEAADLHPDKGKCKTLLFSEDLY